MGIFSSQTVLLLFLFQRPEGKCEQTAGLAAAARNQTFHRPQSGKLNGGRLSSRLVVMQNKFMAEPNQTQF